MKKIGHIILITFLLICNHAAVLSSGGFSTTANLIKSLDAMLGTNNAGTEFYLTFHPGWENTSGNNIIKIFIGSEYPAHVKLSINGKNYSQSLTVTPYNISEFDLSTSLAQCYRKSDVEPPLIDAVFKGFGISVTSDEPIIVYALAKYSNSCDGYLALPVSSLGRQYVIASSPDPATDNTQFLPSYSSIVAAFDNTYVQFTLGGTSGTKTAGGMVTGETRSQVLNKGDVWLIAGSGAFADLSGSVVVSDKPVAVISGNYCANVPIDVYYCNYMIEMQLPIWAWGKTFHVSPILKRIKNSFIKIFSSKPNTKIYRDGSLIGSLNSFGGVENVGYMDLRVEDGNSKPILITADKPITVTQFNTGQEDDGVVNLPFQMVLSPLEQYKYEVSLGTPLFSDDPSSFENYVNLIYQATDNGQIPDNLEFGQEQGDTLYWQNIKSIDPNPGVEFYQFNTNKRYFTKFFVLPPGKFYEFRGNTPITAYVYGSSNYYSYGYPAAMSLTDNTTHDTLAPYVSYSVNCDGSVTNGYVSDRPDDPAGRSNLGIIVQHSSESDNYTFNYNHFFPGSDQTTTWSLQVNDKNRDAVAVITFTDRAGNDTTITIHYYAKKLLILPKSLNFGLFKENESIIKDFIAINQSDAPILISNLNLKFGNQGFTLFFDSLPKMLNQGDTLKFSVKFVNDTSGNFLDSIGIGDSCGLEYLAEVKAAVGIPIINVSDANYLSLRTGKSQSRNITIQNTGTETLKIYSYSGPSSPAFKIEFIDSFSVFNPLILQPNRTYTFIVSFNPTDTIYYSDKIVFSSNANEIDSIAYLYGEGTEPGLEANSYNWEKRRIDRLDRPDKRISPYPPDAPEQVIKLTNSGNEPVKIYNIQTITDNNGEAFEFNRSAFNGLTLSPGMDTIIPVKFHPTKIGNYEFTFEYVNSSDKQVRTTLKGIGCVPLISMKDYNFDTTVINDEDNISYRILELMNLPYEFADTLKQLDLTSLPDDAVSFNLIDFGKSGFQIDKSFTQSPIVVLPGDTLFIQAKFSANKLGLSTAQIITTSDADSEVVSNLFGFGIEARSSKISVTTSGVQTCVGKPDTIYYNVENFGNKDLYIHSLRFDPILPEFSFLHSCCSSDSIIHSNSTVTYNVLYQPTTQGISKTNLIIENSSDNEPVYNVALKGESFQLNRSIRLSPSTIIAEIGQEILYSVILNPGDDLNLAGIKNINLKLSYKSEFLYVPQENIKLGNLLQDKFDLSVVKYDVLNGIIELNLSAKDSYDLDGDGELLQFKLKTYLPKDTSSYSNISVTAVTNDNNCLKLNIIPAGLVLKPTCAKDLRQYIVSSFDYYMSEIQPNPVTTDYADLVYSIAFSGFTEITIYNSLGDIVSQPVSGIIDAGEHHVKLALETLPSGFYFYKIISGPYSDVHSIIITK